MLLFNTITEIGILKVLLILKYTLNILLICLPLITMYSCAKSLLTFILSPNNFNKYIQDIIYKVISALIVLMLPTIINYTFTLIENFDSTKISYYYNNANIKNIKKLEVKYENELKTENATRLAQRKERELKEKEKLRKQAEQIEALNTNSNDENNEEFNATDYNNNGNYGSVTYSNGVFTIPNRRATSNSDIPKQSGQYGLNPIFWERLNKLIKDGQAAGHKITVSSGWRSYSSQYNNWANSHRACSIRSKWVACPGGSRHGFAIAADLKYNGKSCTQSNWNCNSAAKWVHDNAGKYGLKFRLSNEPWHIEPDKISGGNFGKCTASC